MAGAFGVAALGSVVAACGGEPDQSAAGPTASATASRMSGAKTAAGPTASGSSSGVDAELIKQRYGLNPFRPAPLPPSVKPVTLRAADPKVFSRVPMTDKVVFVTIDDGIEKDPSFIQMVKDFQIPITISLADVLIKDDYAYFEKLYQTGFVSIQNHTVSHPLNMPSLSAEEAPKLRPYMTLAQNLGSLIGQLAHDKQVDRAYMSGGGNRNSVTAGLSPEGDPIMRPGDRFIFRVNNYGKTEGTLYKLSYGFCDEDDIPPEPIYTKQYRRSQIDPGRSGQPIADHPIPAEHKKPVVYGRFHYKTIFGSYHSSGFIYRIIASEDSVPIRPPSDAYIEDRTETPDDDDA